MIRVSLVFKRTEQNGKQRRIEKENRKETNRTHKKHEKKNKTIQINFKWTSLVNQSASLKLVSGPVALYTFSRCLMRLEYPLEIIDALRHISQIELLFRREQLQQRKKKMTPANSFSIKR